jgi:hypothetical protein
LIPFSGGGGGGGGGGVEFEIWFSSHVLFCNEKSLVREGILFITLSATQNARQNKSKQK